MAAPPPPGTISPLALQLIVKSEESKFHLPDWIVSPTIKAESGFRPDAPGGGLLQIISKPEHYTGPWPVNLSDPMTNLNVGLPDLAAAYQAIGSPQSPSLSAYDYVLTHSGHNSYTGRFLGGANVSAAQVEANFNRSYQDYQKGTTAGPTPAPSNQQGGLFPSLNPLDGLSGAIGGLGGDIGQALKNVAVFLLPFLAFGGLLAVGVVLLGLEVRSKVTGV